MGGRTETAKGRLKESFGPDRQQGPSRAGHGNGQEDGRPRRGQDQATGQFGPKRVLDPRRPRAIRRRPPPLGVLLAGGGRRAARPRAGVLGMAVAEVTFGRQ
jgi:hypothetical protein